MVAAGRLVGLARAAAASQPGSDGGRTDDQEEIPPLDRHPDTLPRARRVSHLTDTEAALTRPADGKEPHRPSELCDVITLLLPGPDRLDRLRAQRPPRWY